MVNIIIDQEKLEEIISKYMVMMFDEVYQPTAAEGDTCVELIIDELASDYNDDITLKDILTPPDMYEGN